MRTVVDPGSGAWYRLEVWAVDACAFLVEVTAFQL